MRFFSILEDKPSNKKRGWGCVVLFAFDDTEGIEKDLSESPHEFILERYIPGNNLHNEIKKTNKVYKLFDGIGLEKIDYIESFSADDIIIKKFRTHFWEKPEDAFDRIRDMNISNRMRDRGIVSPAPSIEVVAEEVRAEVLESPSRLSPAPPLPCNEDGDAGNPAGEGNNTTTSSVQPPFYDDNQQSLNSMDGGSLWNLVIIKQ
ncbi:22378_t:CDS:2 [Rhizophagus irregularis]|nr:22378_t:CDS:2 [Rhizophagus irregularis]